ncbi:MAG: ABC transporter permease [Bacteroidetes bacterium]|nr:ABC transporter permease [Bacteroidota bacterium]
MADESAVPVPGDEQTQATADKKNVTRPDQSYWSLVKHQFRKHRGAVWSLRFIYVLFFVAVFADFLANEKPIACSYKGTFYVPALQEYAVGLHLAKYPPELANADWKTLKYDWKIPAPVQFGSGTPDLSSSFAKPFSFDSGHYLGTDQLGRDLLSGLIHGSRISLAIGFVSMGIAAIIGVLLGAIAGYFGGWVDIAISRLIELFLNFPVFFLIITIVSFMEANIMLVMVVIGATGWMGIARLIRGEVLRIRNMEYITAATSLGFSAPRIILLHVIPNSLAPVLVSIAFGIAGAILIESTLAFLGFGVPLTVVTWGSALNQARSDVTAWWLAIFPGIMIFLTVLSYNLIGDALRDALDPRLRD